MQIGVLWVPISLIEKKKSLNKIYGFQTLFVPKTECDMYYSKVVSYISILLPLKSWK